ncbi:phospholipid transport system substrate-binding protein [uncultured Gammaproteobacteria bacterium]
MSVRHPVTPIRRFLFIICFALLTMTTSVALPVQAQAADMAAGAGKFVENLGNQALDALSKHAGKKSELVSPFRKLLLDNFDIPTIGRFVLGRFWNETTPEQQKEYLSLFETMIVQMYADRFSSYSGETFKVLSARPETERDSFVLTEVAGNGSPVKVEWRVRQLGSRFGIIDVVVEGVSMSTTQRSEFASVIQSRGGKVEGLLLALRDKVAAFH